MPTKVEKVRSIKTIKFISFEKQLFERETRTCLDGEEQIKREEREKDLEMER